MTREARKLLCEGSHHLGVLHHPHRVLHHPRSSSCSHNLKPDWLVIWV